MAMWFNRFSIAEANRVSIPALATYNVSAVSLSIWVNFKVLAVTPLTWAMLCSLNDFYSLQYDVATAQMTFSYQYTPGGVWRSIWDSGTPTVDTWYHFVGTYDPNGGANNMRIYRNGTLIASATYTDTLYSPAGGIFSIGSLGAGRYLQGVLSDCRIYNRAITEPEVSTIYGGFGHDGICDGLIGRWVLDEGYDGQGAGSQVGVIKDSSEYKNNGDTVND